LTNSIFGDNVDKECLPKELWTVLKEKKELKDKGWTWWQSRLEKY